MEEAARDIIGPELTDPAIHQFLQGIFNWIVEGAC
jgi:hypothetical protein